MAIIIDGREFEGPFASLSLIANEAGVYVILDKEGAWYSILDVGESSALQDRLRGHDRKECWRDHQFGKVCAAVLYLPGYPEASRRLVERSIRAACNPPPPCGCY